MIAFFMSQRVAFGIFGYVCIGDSKNYHLLVSAVSATSKYASKFSMTSCVTNTLSGKETRVGGRLSRCMSGVSEEENATKTASTMAVN